jgi:hypothetical protein
MYVCMHLHTYIHRYIHVRSMKKAIFFSRHTYMLAYIRLCVNTCVYEATTYIHIHTYIQYNRQEQERIDENERQLRNMQKRLKEDELKVLRGDIQVCMFVCIHIRKYVCMYTYTCMYVCVGKND